ncbi:HK97 gp10 family phage protein [Clostridium sp. 19966]|uniref:HK97-gp10 family putative phage morphogenesis protein n=1 Tax=Clostridium sp. 19966 TaxID=2768166 RepID=UPI0028DF3605|nr:HK97-gp10 family putative phage morphogenesis protein [Clostridium sp. 19966]MDT8715440.1 HK97 gp10 family phage protein [Clostridium sp. 19966]
MGNIQGMDSLLKKLQSLGMDTMKSLQIGVENAGKKVQAEAKLLAPVDEGYLRNHIFEETTVSENKVTSKVYTDVEYAAYVEFGTGPVGEASKPEAAEKLGITYKIDKWRGNIPDVGIRWISGQAAQPYMYPAIKNNKENVSQIIQDTVKKQIEKVAKK